MRILIGLLCLCFLIFFHELGHFLAAKLFKVKVESFSIGFGPKLFHKTLKGTDYRISLIPLGGYCGIKGEKDFQLALENSLSEINGEPDSMYGIHPIKRAVIGFAGPFFNFIFAVLSFSIVAGIGYTTYSYSNVITLADETNPEIHSAARDGGIISGDKIIQINDSQINDFSEIITNISSRPDEDIDVKVLRDGNILSFKVHTDLDKNTGTGKIGVQADTVSLHQKEIHGKNFFFSIAEGFSKSFEMIGLTFKGIATLFKGVNIQNSVSGPARVADMLGEVVTESASGGVKAVLLNLLDFLGLISISLFIMNLLPVPVLDGGLILFALIETLIRKKIHPKVYYYIQFIGIFFIIILLVIGLSGDFIYFKNLIGSSK